MGARCIKSLTWSVPKTIASVVMSVGSGPLVPDLDDCLPGQTIIQRRHGGSPPLRRIVCKEDHASGTSSRSIDMDAETWASA